MRRIAAFVCALTLASATIASAAPMPWKKFNEPAILKANKFANPGMCEGKEILLAGFKTDTAVYVMAYSPLNNRILFVYAKLDGLPLEIGFGTVDDGPKYNEIPPLAWQKFIPEIHSDVCTNLFPSTS
jgi:hypothetical protein